MGTPAEIGRGTPSSPCAGLAYEYGEAYPEVGQAAEQISRRSATAQIVAVDDGHRIRQGRERGKPQITRTIDDEAIGLSAAECPTQGSSTG
jgi:hypothetical protein